MKAAHCVPVLMYHHVSPSAGMITTSPRNFERQIAGYARDGYKSLTAEEFAGFLEGKPVPEKSVLITFDDGYLDNWVYAHPVLKKYGMHAMMFLVTGIIGDGPARPVNGDGVALPEIAEHKQSKLMVAAGNTDPVMLRWSEVLAMREAGTFEFHSHTHTHTRWDLTAIDRAQCLSQMRQELADSRATLQEKLGSVSDHFAGRKVISTMSTSSLHGKLDLNICIPRSHTVRTLSVEILRVFTDLQFVTEVTPGFGSARI